MGGIRVIGVTSVRRLALGALATVAATLAAVAPAAADTLWNQSGSASVRGAPAGSINGIMSTFPGDDFAVPAGERWRIRRVNVDGSYAGSQPPHDVVVQVWTSKASGLPREAISSSAIVPPAGLSDPDFALPLDPPVVLRGGRTFWLVVYVRMGLPWFEDGEWFWTDRGVQTGMPAVWSNPGDGWGTGCTDFASRGATCGIDPGAPDQVFKLTGKAVPIP